MSVGIPEYYNWLSHHRNLMTPDVIVVKQEGRFFVELSEGAGIEGSPLYGVSVIEWDGNNFCAISKLSDAWSKSFKDKRAALHHFEMARAAVRRA